MQWEINQEIDIKHGPQITQLLQNALMVSGDNEAHIWKVSLLDNGAAVSVSGTITGYFARPDKQTVMVEGALEGNIASVVLPQAVYAKEGNVQAIMRLSDAEGQVVTLSALILPVRAVLTDAIIDPGELIPSLDDLLAQIAAMEEATARANAAGFNLRGDYNPYADPLYAKHDMVYFNGGSFGYTHDTPSNEIPTSKTHWQQIASRGQMGPFPVYDNLAALIAANPDHKFVYITKDTGKWYHYDGGWVAGGQFTDTAQTKQIEADLLGKAQTTYVDVQDNLKRDKATLITMDDLHTEVKSAMTGGSVAVVGLNVVGGENIKPKIIHPGKTSFIARAVDLYNNSVKIAHRFLSPGGGLSFQIATINIASYAGQSINLSVTDIFCPIASKAVITLKQFNSGGRVLGTQEVTTASQSININALAVTMTVNMWIEYTLAESTDSYYGFTDFSIYKGDYVLSPTITIPGIEARVAVLEADIGSFEALSEMMDEAFMQIETNSSRLSALEGGVPSYYDTHLATKISTINGLVSSLSNYAQFVFVTDGHYDNGVKNSRYLIEHIYKNTDVNLIVNGGDNYTTGGTWTEKQCLDIMRVVTSMFNFGADYRYILGNHDNGMDTIEGQLTADILTNTQLYNTCGMRKYASDVAFDPTNQFQYYWDDTVNNIRYIAMAFALDYVTHAGWTNAWKFLASSLLSAPENSKIIVLNHMIRNGGADIDPMIADIVAIMDAYNNRGMAQYGQDTTTRHYYTDCTGEVILLLGGHSHTDWSTTSATGIPIVITTTDNCYRDESGLTRTPGTISEQAFDVVTVDLDNSIVYFTRIGAGIDRQFSF